MITAKEAKINVIKFNEKKKKIEKWENEILKNIESNSINGLSELKIICNQNDIDINFITNLRNIGYTIELIIPDKNEPDSMMIIKW